MMSQSSLMATSCGGGDRSVVLEEKKLWSDVVRNKMSLVDTMPNNVPNDIIVEILLRLPARSLIRLRWVCKYWFDLISRDSSFVKMHLHHSTAHNEIFNIISTSVLSFSSNSTDDGYEISQCYLRYNCTTRVKDVSREVSIDTPLEYPLGSCRPQIMGSCNGLILLSKREPHSEKLCIWNPCTKEYRVLPHPLNIKGYVDSCMYGFGYDHTIDEYKVIVNTYYYVSKDEEDAPLQSDVQVYTLGTNSWRRVRPNPHIFRRYQPEGVLADGVIYWIDCDNKEIISFDIGKEKFQHVPKIKIPCRSDPDDWQFDVRMKILVFEGSLCVVLSIRDQGNYRAEMWVMKDYVVNNNTNKPLWTKISTIPNLHDYEFSLKPLRFTKDGEILMVTRQKDLFLHDPKKNNDKTLYRICRDESHFIQEVHTESLVSLNSGTYAGQERRKKQTN